LTIEGESEKKSEVEDKNYYRNEVRYGNFHRSVALPASVEADKAEASYENGILKITVSKKEEVKVKKVEVKIKK
jgi:HSP20 family protein